MWISMIVAIDEKNWIWADNDLLCHLSDDLKYFKKVTNWHTVIMWKKTFLSLPNWALPNRKNIVLSQNNNNFENCIKCWSIDECINSDEVKNWEEVFIIWWASIYKAFFDIADKLYITLIHHTFDNANVFFPEIKEEIWKLISQWERHPANEQNEYPFTFKIYERKNKNPDWETAGL